MEQLNYFLGSSVCLAVGYGLYHFGFRKLTFFSLNRFYLLAIVVLALGLPLIHLRFQPEVIKAPVIHWRPALTADFAEQGNGNVADQREQLDWRLLLAWTYVLVSTVLLLRLCLGIGRMVYLAWSQSEKNEGIYVVSGQQITNASFFNILFLDTRTVDTEQVRAHEEAHIRLFHSADRLFLALIKVFFWFDPLVYLIDRALSEVHEFEVDRLLSKRYETKNYAALVLRMATGKNSLPVNHFSALGVKARIRMMFRERSAKVKLIYYSLVLPLILLALYSFSVPAPSTKAPFVLVIDAGHGGQQIGTVTNSGYREKDLNLQIAAEISKVAKERNITVHLTRSRDEDVSFADRVKIRGDAFISIHCNSSSDAGQRGMQLLLNRDERNPGTLALAASLRTELGKLENAYGIPVMSAIGNQPIYVLAHNPAPAVLLETGYLSNKADLAELTSSTYQRAMAARVVDALINYSRR